MLAASPGDWRFAGASVRYPSGNRADRRGRPRSLERPDRAAGGLKPGKPGQGIIRLPWRMLAESGNCRPLLPPPTPEPGRSDSDRPGPVLSFPSAGGQPRKRVQKHPRRELVPPSDWGASPMAQSVLRSAPSLFPAPARSELIACVRRPSGSPPIRPLAPSKRGQYPVSPYVMFPLWLPTCLPGGFQR